MAHMPGSRGTENLGVATKRGWVYFHLTLIIYVLYIPST